MSNKSVILSTAFLRLTQQRSVSLDKLMLTSNKLWLVEPSSSYLQHTEFLKPKVSMYAEGMFAV
jgi:ABC-type transport system involved in cytochrome c biogenesis ATPase subunit